MNVPQTHGAQRVVGNSTRKKLVCKLEKHRKIKESESDESDESDDSDYLTHNRKKPAKKQPRRVMEESWNRVVTARNPKMTR